VHLTLSARPYNDRSHRRSDIAMPVRRKVFRIEEMQLTAGQASVGETSASQQPILAELAALRALLEGPRDGAPGMEPKIDADIAGISDVEAGVLLQLKAETDTIHHAITRTKQEIAALHVNGLNRPESGRVFRELDAVVGGQERAIQQVLAAAEDIDEAANTLSAALKHEQDQALAQDIRDQVIRIFEACNFQDLAGQRISTVLTTLKFIEERVARMMEVWGGIEAFKEYTAAALAEREPAPVLLNGPKLEGDSGHATQEEIDAIFANP
jgi:chemotaxis protein CheZ